MKKINRILIYPLIIMGFVLILIIMQTTAICGGNITSDGGTSVTASGVCWSVNKTSTISDSKTTDGTRIGNFTSAFTGFTANSDFYKSTYAINYIDSGYGNAMSSNTITPQLYFYKNPYIAIGNKIYKSDWGSHWTEVAFSPAPGNINSLAFYNKPCVAIGNKIYKSDWGSHWTEVAFSPAPGNINSLAFYNNPYVAIGNKIYKSDWGPHWTEVAFSPCPK